MFRASLQSSCFSRSNWQVQAVVSRNNCEHIFREKDLFASCLFVCKEFQSKFFSDFVDSPHENSFF